MNGIGGVWFLDGGEGDGRDTLARDTLARLEGPLARRGPDGGDAAWSPPVGMVCRTFPTDPDARRERQPLRGERSRLVWDGRLDEREELRARLGLGPDPTDAGIVLAACERWGDGTPDRMIGDFALAFWTPEGLLLARDPAGVRPLFYHSARGRFFWASTLEALLAAAELPRDVDEEWLAGYFTRTTRPGRTPYRAIRCVPPGHLVRVRPADGAVTVRRYWQPLARGEVRCRDDAGYAGRFEELFRRAVARRLRTDGAAGADLSGGLDSSSVVCVADDLIRGGAVPARDLLPVSFVFERSETADERSFVRLVEERTGRRSHLVREEEAPFFAGLAQPFCEVPALRQCYRARELELVHHLRAHGARVQLRGVGGDHVAWSESPLPLGLADLLARGRLGGFGRSLRRWSRAGGEPYPRLLGQALRAALLPRRRRVDRPEIEVPSWLRTDFARRLRLDRRPAMAPEIAAGARLPSRRAQLGQIGHAIDVVAWSYDRGPAAIEVSYPFLDRDLVEYCLGLPFDQFVRAGETRSIHRRALRRVLPPEVASRPDKTTIHEALSRALDERWAEVAALLDDARIEPFADPAGLREALRRARYGLGGDPFALHALALEAWLRLQEVGPVPAAFERSREPTAPAAPGRAPRRRARGAG